MKYDLSSEFGKRKAQEYLDKLKVKGVQCEVTRVSKTRSRRHNAYFHVLIGLYAIDTGYTAAEAKTVVKRAFGVIYDKEGHKFLKSTADYTDAEMSGCIEKWRRAAAEQGIDLPDSDDYGRHRNEYENMIEANKHHI